jgi:hypothetical protein
MSQNIGIKAKIKNAASEAEINLLLDVSTRYTEASPKTQRAWETNASNRRRALNSVSQAKASGQSKSAN